MKVFSSNRLKSKVIFSCDRGKITDNTYFRIKKDNIKRSNKNADSK